MKTFTGIGLFVATLAVASLAQPPAPAQHLQALQRMKAVVVDQQLNLTADQREKAKSLRAQAATAAKAIRESSALTPEQKRDQLAAAGKAARELFRATLTTAQQVKFDELASHPQQLNQLAERRLRMAAIAKELGLTPEQRTSLRAIQARTAAAVKVVRTDTALAVPQKQAKVRELLQGARTEMRAALTPEQRTKLDRIRQRLLAPLGPLATG